MPPAASHARASAPIRCPVALVGDGGRSLHADALVVTDTRTVKSLHVCYEPDTDGNAMSVPAHEPAASGWESPRFL